MINQTQIITANLNALDSGGHWFSTTERVLSYGVSRVVRLITPVLQMVLGILVKRVFGLNTAGMPWGRPNCPYYDATSTRAFFLSQP